MFRKFLAVMIIVIVNFSCDISQARTTGKKYTAPFLTSYSFYQLGESDLVLKLYGSNLPDPDLDIDGGTLVITLNNTRLDNQYNMNFASHEFIGTVPLISGVDVKELSGDKISLFVKSDTALEFYSSSRSVEGLTLRIKADEKNLLPAKNIIPPPLTVRLPVSRLPFEARNVIYLALHDSDLSEALRLAAANIGKNIIIDTSLPEARVNMNLTGVRADEAINNIMRVYGLVCYMAGENIIIFGTRDGLNKFTGDDITQAFEIFYADPSAIKTMLMNLTGLDDKSIAVDERLKALYVRSNPAKLEEVSELIRMLDVPAKQVMIHAVIFEFNDTAAREVENAIEAAYKNLTLFSISPRGGIAIDYDNSEVSRNTRIISGIFTALERRNKGKVLASPSVTALDGHEATIKLTQDYIYVSGRDDAGNPTTRTEEIGPRIRFTPKIERDGFVNLKLKIETGEIIDLISGGNSVNLPITSNREVETQVRVKEGTPFVLGGLYQEARNNFTSSIPIISNIPLIGELFTYRSNAHDRTQAIIIVTPYILDTR